MPALALAHPAATPVRRRHVGFDLVVQWPGSPEELTWQLRSRLAATHLRLESLFPRPDGSCVCRLRLANPKAHMTPAAAIEALQALGDTTWTSVEVLEEIDGQPAFGSLR